MKYVLKSLASVVMVLLLLAVAGFVWWCSGAPLERGVDLAFVAGLGCLVSLVVAFIQWTF